MRVLATTLSALAMFAGGAGTAADGVGTERQDALARGWAALRAMDCGRCHGRDYGGWAAPSLVAAVRDGSRERFERIVLDGDIKRGMPGYRSQTLVVAELDAIYAYLSARAGGAIGSAAPQTASTPRAETGVQGATAGSQSLPAR